MDKFISNSLEHFIEEITADGKISINEYKKLRDLADEKFDEVVEQFGRHNNFSAFQKSMDVSMQLLQTSILDAIKDKKLTPLGKAIVRDAFKAQIEYLELGGKLFLDKFIKIG